MGMATVRIRRPLPSRSARTHRPFPLLDGRDVEFSQLVPPQGAADQKCQNHIVPLPFQGRSVGNRQQILGLFASQPVPQPGSLLADVQDVRIRPKAPSLYPLDGTDIILSLPTAFGTALFTIEELVME
jgi:hypothetical protein